jgi:myo-inositol-1(or 4)-monophosphatase
MDIRALNKISEIAKQACFLGGRVIKEEFSSPYTISRKSKRDVQLYTDVASEQVIIDFIKSHYPSHSIFAEENGQSLGDADHLWVVDPLDGTNNYVLSIPYCGVALAYFYAGELRFACAYEPFSGLYYQARRGEGAHLNGISLLASSIEDVAHSSISLVTNYTDETGRVLMIEALITKHCKRVLKTWAPAMDLPKVAAGRIGGMVCLGSSYLDKCGGILMVQEANGIVTDLEGKAIRVSIDDIASPIDFVASSSREIHTFLLSSLDSLDLSI